MPRPQRRISSHALLLLPLMLLSGCTSGLITTLGPDYHQPETQAAKSWQTSQAEAPGVMPADLRDWWKQFDDPELFRFLTAAQRVSASVADARARIQDARAGLVTAVAQGLPRLAEVGRSRGSHRQEWGGVGRGSKHLGRNAGR